MSINNQSILIVENEPGLIFTLRDTLENEGYQVQVAENGNLALEMLTDYTPDLMIMAVILPGINGFELCKNVREQNLTFPIIILTTRDEEIDKVTGLNVGADDYITKPFGVKELLARIQARLRRSNDFIKGKADKLDLDYSQLDLNAAVVHRPDGDTSLTTREVEILRFLAESANEPVSRKALLEHVWRYDHSTSTRTVDVHISKLRTKIEQHPDEPKYLVTLHGVGYMLKVKQSD